MLSSSSRRPFIRCGCLLLFISVVLLKCSYGKIFSNSRRIARSNENTSSNGTPSVLMNKTKTLTAKRQVFPAGPMFASCGPGGCAPPAACCACPPNAVYSPAAIGCAPPITAALPPIGPAALPPPPPLAAPLPPPPPVPAGRLIPQALPGAPCEPGVECTGGSVCSMGICLCPPELVQEGTVCVSRTIYGVAPPPPPPAPLAPGPPPAFAAFHPAPAPLPYYPPPPPAPVPPPPAFGQCGPAYAPAFSPGFGGCVQKRHPSEAQFPVDIADSGEQS